MAPGQRMKSYEVSEEKALHPWRKQPDRWDVKANKSEGRSSKNRANSGVWRRRCQGKTQLTDQRSRHSILGAIRLLKTSTPTAKPFSSLPSPAPIAPSVRRRSSFVQLPRACVCHVEEQPLLFPEPSPNVLFGQPRFSPELTRRAFSRSLSVCFAEYGKRSTDSTKVLCQP